MWTHHCFACAMLKALLKVVNSVQLFVVLVAAAAVVLMKFLASGAMQMAIFIA